MHDFENKVYSDYKVANNITSDNTTESLFGDLVPF